MTRTATECLYTRVLAFDIAVKQRVQKCAGCQPKLSTTQKLVSLFAALAYAWTYLR